MYCGTAKVAQCLRTLSAFPEDWDLGFNTHNAANTCL